MTLISQWTDFVIKSLFPPGLPTGCTALIKFGAHDRALR